MFYQIGVADMCVEKSNVYKLCPSFENERFLLRLDLRSDYEEQNFIINILSLILSSTFELFDCGKIATKAVPAATERTKALKDIGFAFSEEKLIGHGGEYNNYFVIEKIIATQTTVDSSC